MTPAIPSLMALFVAVLPVDKDAVKKSVETVLSGSGYAFCHEPRYPLWFREHPWCPLVGDKSAACPALPEACKADPTDDEDALPQFRGDGRGRAGKIKGKPVEAEDEDEWTARPLRLPPLGGLGRGLLWLLLAAGAAALVYAIVKNARKRNRDEDEALPPPAIEEDEAARAAARKVIETDVQRLLARARAAAAAGRYEDAIDDAWAAVVRRLEGDGLIRVHPSRTNGDYLHELRERADLRAEVRSIARDVERVQFGADEASAERFGSILDRVVPLVSRALAALLVAAAFSSIPACDPRTVAHRGRFEYSPSGTQGVLELLAGSGLSPHRRLRPLDKLRDGAEGPRTLVIQPDAWVSPAEADKLLKWADDGHTLIVLGYHGTLLDKLHVRVSYDTNNEQALRPGKPYAKALGGLRPSVPPGPTLALEESRAGATPLLLRGRETYAMVFNGWDDVSDHAEATASAPRDAVDDDGKIALGGRVVVFADNRLFTNAALPVGDDAALLLAILEGNGPRVEFATENTGRTAETSVEAVTRGKLAPFLLQLGLLLGLFFVYRGAAFGRPRDPASAMRRRFVEHVRSLGVQLAKAGASRHAAALYAGYALDRLRDRVRLGDRRGMTPLAEAIAARTGRPLGEVMALLVEAQGLRDGGAAGARDNPAEDLAIVRRLSRLLEQVGGTR